MDDWLQLAMAKKKDHSYVATTSDGVVMTYDYYYGFPLFCKKSNISIKNI